MIFLIENLLYSNLINIFDGNECNYNYFICRFHYLNAMILWENTILSLKTRVTIKCEVCFFYNFPAYFRFDGESGLPHKSGANIQELMKMSEDNKIVHNFLLHILHTQKKTNNYKIVYLSKSPVLIAVQIEKAQHSVFAITQATPRYKNIFLLLSLYNCRQTFIHKIFHHTTDNNNLLATPLEGRAVSDRQLCRGERLSSSSTL